jgi:hypothetical protein
MGLLLNSHLWLLLLALTTANDQNLEVTQGHSLQVLLGASDPENQPGMVPEDGGTVTVTGSTVNSHIDVHGGDGGCDRNWNPTYCKSAAGNGGSIMIGMYSAVGDLYVQGGNSPGNYENSIWGGSGGRIEIRLPATYGNTYTSGGTNPFDSNLVAQDGDVTVFAAP